MTENKVINEGIVEAEVLQDVEQGIVAVGLNSLMSKGSDMYCSIKADSFDEKAKVYNALNSPDKKLSEMINIVIEVKDIVAHEVQLVNEETGLVTNCLRTILVGADGTTYNAVSQGVANSLTRIFQIFGEPSTWEKPIKVKPVQKVTNNGTNKVTILEVVMK